MKLNDSNHIEISCKYFANLGKSIHIVTDHNLGLLIQDWPLERLIGQTAKRTLVQKADLYLFFDINLIKVQASRL